jgi:hypothetical protein
MQLQLIPGRVADTCLRPLVPTGDESVTAGLHPATEAETSDQNAGRSSAARGLEVACFGVQLYAEVIAVGTWAIFSPAFSHLAPNAFMHLIRAGARISPEASRAAEFRTGRRDRRPTGRSDLSA